MLAALSALRRAGNACGGGGEWGMSSFPSVSQPGSGSGTAVGAVDATGAGSGPPSPGTSGSASDHRYLLDNARAGAGERFTWIAELFDGVTHGPFDPLGPTAGGG